ncbi:MAG: thioredoxin family protein [Deltaproteobacteria bacterium]|nr:thioredoxin family protein [Deltaproteobacteria bacterium]
MARTPSVMPPLGGVAPDFTLPDPSGQLWTRDRIKGPKGLLVMFICNHCPFVKHIASELARLGKDLAADGIGVVAISSNDVANYPDDRPELMALEAKHRGYTFPYLYDASQDVAKAFQAACTPDFFLYDNALRLVYRGQLDASRPGNETPVTGQDLRRAAAALVAGQAVPEPQIPSIGCNIKWRPAH